jgi:hypothetical protein
MTSEPEEDLDISAGLVPHHPLGTLSGFDHETGLPIVKRRVATAPAPVEDPAANESNDAVTAGTTPSAKQVLKPATPAFAKGQPVQLADGSKGKIAHMVGNMRTVRVRMEDGRNVTVSQNALKPADSVLVKSHYRRTPS